MSDSVALLLNRSLQITRLSGTDTINGISNSWIELGLDSFWHPVFADFSRSIVARVALTIPAGWDVVTSGTVNRANGTIEITSSIPLIDIPIVAAPHLEHSDGDRVSVYHVSGEQPGLVAKTLTTTRSCARYLDERYSTRERPMPPVKMVIAPRGGPGYARRNYIVITRGANRNTGDGSPPRSLHARICRNDSRSDRTRQRGFRR